MNPIPGSTRRIFVTGVTGAIGSQLVLRLVARGWRVVCLVRPKAGRSAAERLADEFGPLASEMTAIAGDIREPMLGVSPRELAALKGRIDVALHCAASVSFDTDVADDTWRSNLDGARHFLDVVEALGLREAHQVSTAYVAGDSAEFLESDFDRGRARNPYEASKRAAEALVRERFPGAFSIYRPSIVVGDSRTGFTRAFDGYYGICKAWSRITRMFAGRGELPEGIRRDGERLYLPLTLRGRPDVTLNLVPIDWVSEMMASLLELPATGRCFHLAHPQPANLGMVMSVSAAHLGIDGSNLTPTPPEAPSRGVQVMQRRLDGHLERYACYINGEASFGHAAVREALGDGYVPPPLIDPPALRRMLDYAVSVDFEGQPHAAAERELARAG